MAKRDYHLVVVRSTVLPGSTREVVIPTLEKESGKKAGRDFGVCVNPEFLREGSSVEDFEHPPFTVVGSDTRRDVEILKCAYAGIGAELVAVSVETAEMIKYVANAFHAAKVCFANEIGRVSKALGIDSRQLMGLFARDTKLNVSPAYLRPGFAFGGSCLPKDLRALNYLAKARDIEAPLLASLLPSNQCHLEHALRMITRGGRRKIGLVGLAFKPGTDDLRESPLVSLVERLIDRGFKVRIFDAHVQVSRLLGANRQYIESELPYLKKLMVSRLQELVDFSEVLVVGHGKVDLAGFDLTGKEVIELEPVGERPTGGSFQGICW